MPFPDQPQHVGSMRGRVPSARAHPGQDKTREEGARVEHGQALRGMSDKRMKESLQLAVSGHGAGQAYEAGQGPSTPEPGRSQTGGRTGRGWRLGPRLVE